MAPKRKAAPKPKTVIPPILDDKAKTMDSTNFTVRRPAVKDNLDELIEIPDDEKLPILDKSLNMNATVMIKKLPEFGVKIPEPESELDNANDDDDGNDDDDNDDDDDDDDDDNDDEEQLIKKIVQKKTKTKPKTNKKSSSEENLSKDEGTVSKSRKRPVDKDRSELSKLISSVNELPKRNRRAASVDKISEISSSSQGLKNNQKVVNEDVKSKNIKKTVKKEKQITLPSKVLKAKINTKKQINDEEDVLSVPVQEINIQGKLKSKRGSKKELVDGKEDEQDIEIENITKQTSRNRDVSKGTQVDKKPKRIPKSKQTIKSSNESEELGDTNDSFDSESNPKHLVPKPKRKGKESAKSPANSEESSDINNIVTTPEKLKPKQVRKGKNTIDHPKEIEENIKLPKRGVRKVRGKDFEEEVMQKSPINDIDTIKTGDLPNSVPATPESEKNENEHVVVKRKGKAKTVKK